MRIFKCLKCNSVDYGDIDHCMNCGSPSIVEIDEDEFLEIKEKKKQKIGENKRILSTRVTLVMGFNVPLNTENRLSLKKDIEESLKNMAIDFNPSFLDADSYTVTAVELGDMFDGNGKPITLE